MSQVYYSTPRYGKDTFDISKELKEVQKDLPENYDLINLWDYRDLPDVESYEDKQLLLLSRAMFDMSIADTIIFSSDWSTSERCRIEMNAALSYRKKIIVLPRKRGGYFATNIL